ncbi:E3 ubiquitin-protein ligase E3D isoform X1 [Otolemur garnettii]|uniref:E3 ubiquitin-protein ligase E3D isoform X1 n=1 Tax=Otolemur garnettii TaxID=30611 RepID=UPI000C7F264C|nr:E3 ubiquitin-protein ligase E3D isoform X1 [Otolemur garnettii]
MAATAAGTRVFLEVRRQLQSALLVLGEVEGGGLPMDLSLTPSSLCVEAPAGCTELRLPAWVRLEPASCRGLHWDAGDGLHLRLRARAEPSMKSTSMFNQSPQAQECCTVYCQTCGEIIIKDRKLLRVLPLPGEDWGALVGEWCCHPDPFANKPLQPCEHDCFIGDSFFLVNLRTNLWHPGPEVSPAKKCHRPSENHFKLEPKANTKVICKRCKVILGETVSSETTKFYMTEIIILPSDKSFPIISRSEFVQSTVARCLVELSARSTFRFTIQGRDGKVYILLWLLNSDSLVIESLRSSKWIKKFPLLEDIAQADCSSVRSAVKVLYQPCVRGSNREYGTAK